MADVAEFSMGLLNPDAPVPLLVKGQIERRYAVYRNNVTVALIRALEANFPAVRRLLGDQYFAGFAREFAQAHPPSSPLMFTYGAAFPDALAREQDLASYPYLKDVAQLEILWRESYHAVDADCLTGDAFASVEPDVLFDCQFVAHPAMRLLRSEFAVRDIFEANRGVEALPQIDPSRPQCVLATRPRLDVFLNLISPSQYLFFSALQSGETLHEALERSAGEDDDFDLPAMLTLLIQSGALQSIQIS